MLFGGRNSFFKGLIFSRKRPRLDRPDGYPWNDRSKRSLQHFEPLLRGGAHDPFIHRLKIEKNQDLIELEAFRGLRDQGEHELSLEG